METLRSHMDKEPLELSSEDEEQGYQKVKKLTMAVLSTLALDFTIHDFGLMLASSLFTG